MDELRQCGFILFLNKRDIFEQKLRQYNDFNDYFRPFLPVGRVENPLTAEEAEHVCLVVVCIVFCSLVSFL